MFTHRSKQDTVEPFILCDYCRIFIFILLHLFSQTQQVTFLDASLIRLRSPAKCQWDTSPVERQWVDSNSKWGVQLKRETHRQQGGQEREKIWRREPHNLQTRRQTRRQTTVSTTTTTRLYRHSDIDNAEPRGLTTIQTYLRESLFRLR
jgi:hypothetical protein